MNRPKIVGVLNVTPDSFSDGGKHLHASAAVRHAERLVREGADIVDVGGESTRPGAARVDPAVERERVLPVIAALAERGIVVSIDTMNAGTAEASIAAGATIVNDVSGGLADRDMPRVVAASGARYIASHWRGHSDTMTSRASYDDAVADVADELRARVDALHDLGVRDDQLILDPGLGFAKNGEHNWQLLRGLERLTDLGFPVLIGASRKRFLAALPQHAEPLDGVDPRDLPTAVVSALVALSGAWGVRVHDVASTASALDVVDAWRGDAA